jgi:ribosomal protein L11 methylase PrmA
MKSSCKVIKCTAIRLLAVLAAARHSSAFTYCASAFLSPITTKSINLRKHRPIRNRLNPLHTVSNEPTDANLATDIEEDEPWVIRQITFLDLTASGSPSDDEKSELDARNFSEFLMEIGACSVSITDADANTLNEDPLFHEPSLTTCPNDYLEDTNDFAMVLNDVAAGRNVWKKCHVSAHFPSSLFDVPTIVDAVRHTFQLPTTPRYEVDTVPDLDWIKEVQESWNPIVLKDSKFVLRFPWHEDALVMKTCQDMEREKMMEGMAKRFSSGVKREGAVVHFEDDDDNESGQSKQNREYVQIRLEGGIAFGTGEHPTTRLCLDWIRDKVEMRLQMSNDDEGQHSLNVMDYGSGSGVLGIAAAAVIRDHLSKSKRSKPQQAVMKTNVIGLEIDADAIHIANDNSLKNKVEMKNYLPHVDSLDEEALSVVLRAMQRKRNKETIKYIPDELNGQIYDLCVANILAGPLVKLAPTVASLVKSPGGEIGLSGILATQSNSVVEAYGEYFEDVKVAAEEGGWVLVTGKRR